MKETKLGVGGTIILLREKIDSTCNIIERRWLIKSRWVIGCNRVKIIPNPGKKGFGPEYIKAIKKKRDVIGCWL